MRITYQDSPGKRQCSRCGEIKPATLEFFHQAHGDRLRRTCKACLSTGGAWRKKVKAGREARREAEWQAYLARARGSVKKGTQRLKEELVFAYGGCCSCCGETALAFLTLEHLKRDGKEHRTRVGGGNRVWRDLKRRGWPQEGFTVYCWNCQMATRYGDVCPHTIQLWRDLTRGPFLPVNPTS